MHVKIIDLSYPASTETVAKTASAAPRSLRTTGDLPHDVVREILKNLSDSDAMKLSILSKAFHAAFPPRPTDVTCKTLSKTVSLREWLTQSTGNALRLVSLDVRCTSAASKISPVFRAILSAAQNLRSLTCGAVELDSVKARDTMGSLPHLSDLKLFKPSRSLLKAMTFPQTLSSLSLVRLSGGISWSELARSLSGLASLTRLVLINSVLDDPDIDEDLEESDADDEDADDPPTLPTITSLEASSTDLPYNLAVFARTFPNANTLVLQDTHFPSNEDTDEDVEDRVLRKVSILVSDSDDVECSIPWPTEHLMVLTFNIEHLELDGLCNKDDLIVLTLRVLTFSWDSWTEWIGMSIPNTVRLLELETFDTDFNMTVGFFADLFEEHDQGTVGEFPALTVLSIVAPSFPGRLDELRKRLFQNAVLALPSLRYVALASPRSVPQDFSDLSGDRAPWRWWRVIRRSQRDVEFKEIPAWEGERVRRYFREADREKADRFDEEFNALR